ncbi:hypothetical protein QBC37DRAFT_78976 [Rhypophila decipiens]|uniref:Zn(2)-C6 fungal-type domain-containing protein n=1 Tax=Rhypophila decipiens TaxID=261697 RepID=A0AAN6XZC9_9PEZI|nr:hypothetical protein QBC37DRAFT_78976 [Rhypophila decipiens]
MSSNTNNQHETHTRLSLQAPAKATVNHRVRQREKRNLQAWCEGCRRRKIKCDQAEPKCGPCARFGIDCIVRKPGATSTPGIKKEPVILAPDTKDLPVGANKFQVIDLNSYAMSLVFPSEEEDDGVESPPNSQQHQSFLLDGLGGQSASGQKEPEISLATYHPSANDSPLTNGHTAALFWHFINVVAPTISLYESSGMYNGRFALVKPIPVKVPYAAPEVSLWTESFPMMSFHHPALLQAMLALSSLHSAKLQQVPPTAAMKHYHLALRRTARNIQDPSKKAHPATAACMLLLAYFEMWMPDFERWRNHLNGLSQLFNDGPSVNAGAVVVTAGEWSFTVQRPANENILGAGLSIASGRRSPEEFDQLREVYWSLFRMDVFQSFLGGTSPFLAPPRARSQYPPRAGIGDLIAIHGTSDNLFSLLRKVADYVTEVEGCKAAAMREPGVVVDASAEKEDSARSVDIFAARRREGVGRNLARLQQEFEDFKRHLGEEYEPLVDESFPVGLALSSFGSSQQFRSYAVAGIWMNFYMGLIHLRQLELSLSHQETAAPELNERISQDTAQFVDHICQIAAGLMADMDVADSTATPAHAAALIESCVPLSIAGGKITDMSKRDWVVQYLLDVEQLTGCQLATYAREACESCWVEMAASGWGPPYLKLEDSAASGTSSEKGRHNVGGEIRNRSRASSVVYQDEQHDAPGLFALEGNLDKLNLTEGGGARNDGQLGTSQYTTRNPSTERVQGMEDWKQAAEVTSQLKARIEQMKVGQLQSEQSVSTRDTGDIMVRRQQIMDKKAHLLDLKRGRAYQKRLEGGQFEIAETLASQFVEQSNATVKRLNLPIQPKQERGERPGVDGSMEAPKTETSVAVTTSDLGTDDSSWSMEETDDESQASTIKSEGVVDPAARVLRIVERNKQRVVKEVSQYCRRIIGNRQLAQQQGHAVGDGVDMGEDRPPSGSSKQGKGIASSSGGGRADQRKTQSKARRGRGDDDDREGDERDERRPNKKPRVSADGTAAEGLKLACPYFKRNPKAPRIGQSCAGPGWNTIHRLK